MALVAVRTPASGATKWLGRISSSKKAQISTMAQVNTMAHEARLRNQTINTLFEHARQSEEWETGDLGAYTRDMLDMRVGLRYERSVLHALEDWWRACESLLDDVQRPKGCFDRHQYLVVFMKVYRALCINSQ